MPTPYASISVVLIGCLSLIALMLLLSGYRKSRNKAFLWLAVGLVVWPFAEVLIEHYLNNVVREVVSGKHPNAFPYSRLSLVLPINGKMSVFDVKAIIMLFNSLVRQVFVVVGLFYLIRSVPISNQAGQGLSSPNN